MLSFLQTAPGSSPPPSPTAAPPVVERTATGRYSYMQYKVVFDGSSSLRLVIGSQNSCHHSNQSDALVFGPSRFPALNAVDIYLL